MPTLEDPAAFDLILPRHLPLVDKLQQQLGLPPGRTPRIKNVGYVWAKPEDVEDPTMPCGFYREFSDGERLPRGSMVVIPQEDIPEIIDRTPIWVAGASTRGFKLYLGVMVF